MVKTKKIKLKFALRGHAAGEEISIRTDDKGVPLDRYWRDRFRDAKIDKCVKFVSAKDKKGA